MTIKKRQSSASYYNTFGTNGRSSPMGEAFGKTRDRSIMRDHAETGKHKLLG